MLKYLFNTLNALTPFFWQTYDQCYQLNKFMQQFDMFIIQTLNKTCTKTKKKKDIQFILITTQQFYYSIYFLIKLNLYKK
jgi:hypothetical protein